MARAGGCGAGSGAQGPVCPAQRPRARMAGSQRSEEARAEREKRAWFRDQEGRVHPALLLPTVWPREVPLPLRTSASSKHLPPALAGCAASRPLPASPPGRLATVSEALKPGLRAG